MLPRLLIFVAGFALGALRPSLGKEALKQAVKVGMALQEMTKSKAERVKEDIADIVTEIEHERKIASSAAAEKA